MARIWRSICLMIAFAAGVTSAQAQEFSQSDGRTLIQIKAEGHVKADPDMMLLKVSVVTTGETASRALEANNMLAAQVIAAIKDSQIELQSLQTSRLNVRPQVSRNRDRDAPPVILGYTANNSLDIELAEVSDAGELISLVFDAGANEIDGPFSSIKTTALGGVLQSVQL